LGIGTIGVNFLEYALGGGINSAEAYRANRPPHLAVDAVEITNLSRKKVDAERTAESPGIHRAEDTFHTALRTVDAAAKSSNKESWGKFWKIKSLGTISTGDT
jgi:hypothetical protein